MDNEDNNPEYTEYGIKIHKLKLTLKVSRRGQQHNTPEAAVAEDGANTADPASEERRINRSASRASSIADSLRMLDLDPRAGSRRGLYYRRADRTTATTSRGGGSAVASSQAANWEFEGFYNTSTAAGATPSRVATPSSSGYGSTAPSSASAMSSSLFRWPPQQPEGSGTSRRSKLVSTDDSVYSDVYSTIDENDERGGDCPFGDEDIQVPTCPAPKPPSSHHSKTPSNASSTSTLPAPPPRSLSRSPPPPLPPRTSMCRPPALPPYPSTIVRAVQQITEPIAR